MDFLVLLSLVSITQTVVLARPSDMNSKTKRSTADNPRKALKHSSIKFPVDLENGFTVIVNGTLDTKSELLEVIFPSSNRSEKDQCRITYNYKTNIIDITPEHAEWKPEKYNLHFPSENNNEEEHPTFSIKLQASTVGDMNMFKLSFEGNKGGESSLMTCDVNRFEHFERIDFTNGVHSITSVFVEF